MYSAGGRDRGRLERGVGGVGELSWVAVHLEQCGLRGLERERALYLYCTDCMDLPPILSERNQAGPIIHLVCTVQYMIYPVAEASQFSKDRRVHEVLLRTVSANHVAN